MNGWGWPRAIQFLSISAQDFEQRVLAGGTDNALDEARGRCFNGRMMTDPQLLKLLGFIALLNVLHLLDHIVRGDFHWPIDEQSVGFIVVATIILGGMGLGVRLYRAGRVGSRFWTIVGLLGLGLGWLSHFSPTTDQPVGAIYSAYASPVDGALAVGCLLLLMLAVLVATVHAGALWGNRRGAKPSNG